MATNNTNLKKYYEKNGNYLQNHAKFLQSADLAKDTAFLIKALSLKKTDKILDIACGQGRHTNALAKRGYTVSGVDFSKFLLDLAQQGADSLKSNCPNYYRADVENLTLPQKYTKAYWFFSDLANINLQKAISSISDNLELGGKSLFDTDSFFRILKYLQNNKNDYQFDTHNLNLIDKNAKLLVPYPVLPTWESWFKSEGLTLEKVFGDYDFREYTINSPRLIMLVKKTA